MPAEQKREDLAPPLPEKCATPTKKSETAVAHHETPVTEEEEKEENGKGESIQKKDVKETNNTRQGQKQEQQQQEQQEQQRQEKKKKKALKQQSGGSGAAEEGGDEGESDVDTKEDGEAEGGGDGGEGGGGAVGASAGKKKKKKKKKKSGDGGTQSAADGGEASALIMEGGATSSSVMITAAAGAAATAGGRGGGGKASPLLTGAAAEAAATAAAQDSSSVLRKLGVWKSFPQGQTWPPTETIQRLYKSGSFPIGEVRQLTISAKRAAAAEEEEKLRLQEVDIEAIREAAECHRQVRRYIQSIARPGIQLIDLCRKLEAKSRELLGCSSTICSSSSSEGLRDGSSSSSSSSSSSGNSSKSTSFSVGDSSPSYSPLDRGWGFPTGCSLNHCAAHYTPNPGDKRILEAEDICKLDFGVQVRGRIIDCAFTIAFDEKFDPLIQATQDGTNTGLAHAGVDARLSEIGGYIQEAIESYEMEIDGKAHPIKAIRNLTGHSVDLYQIHAGKSVPIVKAPSTGGAISSALSNRMEEGEVYAIECFASTGRAFVFDEGECSHYMKRADAGFIPLRLKSAKDLLKVIEENFGTLAFCRRWLEDLGCSHHLMALKQLVEKQIVTPYPPLSDVKRSFTSQMEHTVYIGSKSVEVVSRGEDF